MSAFATAMLVTGLFVAAGIIVLAATMGSLDPHDRKVIARRVGWILLGAAGMPALLVGLAELVGFPIAAVAFGLGFLAANFEFATRMFLAVYGIVFAWVLLAIAVNHPSGANDWIIGVFLAFSILAALLSASKLGMMVGRRGKGA